MTTPTWQDRAERAEAELARLREQEPDNPPKGLAKPENIPYGVWRRGWGAIAEWKAQNGTIAAAPPAQPADLIPQDALFVCGQMGAHVTRVRTETAQPVQRHSALRTTPKATPHTREPTE